MNSIKNKVTLIGSLGCIPEIKSLDNKKVACISLATTEIYKNQKGEKVTDTTWHNVILDSPLVEMAEKLLKKGSEIAIEGKLINRSYIDEEFGKCWVTEVLANELVILGKS